MSKTMIESDDQFFDSRENSMDADNATNENATIGVEQSEHEEELRTELAKLEDEILTLRQVLSAKVRQSGELKRQLGITPMVEFKQDFKQGLTTVKESDAYMKTNTAIHNVGDKITNTDAYQKTNEAFKTVGTKTATAFSSIGAFTSKKLGDVRNSNTFKSFEEKVGGAYTNVKSRVTGSQSEQNFGEALQAEDSTMAGGAASMPATPMEENVPLTS